MRALILSLLVISPANDAAEAEKAVRALVESFAAAWNRADAKAMAAQWTADGTLFTPDETDVRGRDLIERLLARDLAGLFKGKACSVAVRQIRWLGADAALVDFDQFVGEQRLVVTGAVQREEGKWLFSDLRAAAPLPRKDPPSFRLTRRALPLTAEKKSVLMDYLATDRRSGRVWIPAGDDGAVDALDPATDKLTRIGGFSTVDVQIFGRPAKAGPTAVAVGEGVAYIGNRGDATICAIDAASLEKGPCLVVGGKGGLEGTVDGLAYVSATHELWATLGAPPLGVAPPHPAVTVFDASSPRALKVKLTVPLPAAPEGYAVDDAHGLFFTNLEDENQTVAIDVRKHQVVGRWDAHCGASGPRGLAVDPQRRWVFVACTDRVVVLDAAEGGALLASAPAGQGIDNIDYLPSRSQLYVAAGQSGLLTIFGVNERGGLGILAAAPTARAARVVVAGNDGTAYVADVAGGQILAFSPAGR
jgi:uncharacterized protein (TIGR02246 family)